jgi:sulfite reductase (ferredoxin)
MQNGRLKGDAKKALRGVIERYELPVTLTANQNIILRDVQPAWKDDIQATLEVGITCSFKCHAMAGVDI